MKNIQEQDISTCIPFERNFMLYNFNVRPFFVSQIV